MIKKNSYPEMAEDVDVEHSADLLGVVCQQRVDGHDACVVDH